MPIPIEPAAAVPVAGLTGRLQFPATDDRLVYKNNGNNLPFLSQAGITVTVYTDAGGTVLADIVDSGGVAISGSVLTVDANSQIPLFFGPVGVEILYVKTATGPLYPISVGTQFDLFQPVSGLPTQDLTALGLYLPEAHGAKRDGSTDDTAAINAAITAAKAAQTALSGSSMGQARVWFSHGVYPCHSITVPGQVLLEGHGTTFLANGSGPILTFSNFHGGVRDIFFNGGGASRGASGVVFDSTARWNTLSNCRFDSFSGRAVWTQSGSIANDIQIPLATNCLLTNAGLVTYTGVVEVDGTDHYLHHSEISGSRLTLSATGFVCAVVLLGANSMVTDIQAEIADIGMVINGTDFKINNVRADLNMAHGFNFIAGSGAVVGCQALNNSQAADNTYNGFNYVAGQFRHSACQARSTVANRHHFGFQDNQNSGTSFNTFDASCVSEGSGANAFQMAAFAPGHWAQTNNSPFPVLAGATTLNVTPGFVMKNVQLQSTSPVTFTGFTSGIAGQELTIFGDGFTTIQNNGTMVLLGGTNVLLALGQSMQFVNNNGIWYQTSGVTPDVIIMPQPGSNTAFPWSAQNMGGARFQIAVPTQIRYFDWEVTTQAGNVDVGIIKLSGANHLTYTRIVSTGPVACPAVGAIRSDLGVLTLSPGDYAMVLWSDGAPSIRAQGSRSDLQSTRQSVLKTGIASGGIPASGTLTQFWSTGFAFALEGDL